MTCMQFIHGILVRGHVALPEGQLHYVGCLYVSLSQPVWSGQTGV